MKGSEFWGALDRSRECVQNFAGRIYFQEWGEWKLRSKMTAVHIPTPPLPL
jgi:hypothetical protein